MEKSKGTLQPWTRTSQERVYETRVFDVTRQQSRSPRTGKEHDFFVLDACDWVNVIPLTSAQEVVMIRQYRHGIEDFTLEIPGGMIDSTDASPRDAGRREMIEESGYDSSDLVSLGWIHPNPAIQANRCFSFVARDVELKSQPTFDGTEQTEVVLEPLARIPELIGQGRITHALVVVAFHWLGLKPEATSNPRELLSGDS